ncbi:MAG: hypothetical protein JSW06_09350 [Thermoplasmatales archaeon]|nr:MAG: hypothetical protein JSW06_09350 [Thermoplasmatales archaeon]
MKECEIMAYDRINLTLPHNINIMLNEVSKANMRTRSNMVAYLVEREYKKLKSD